MSELTREDHVRAYLLSPEHLALPRQQRRAIERRLRDLPAVREEVPPGTARRELRRALPALARAPHLWHRAEAIVAQRKRSTMIGRRDRG